MEANKINLLEFISSGKRTFHIPVYQRNYDWKLSHCKRLFLDVEKISTDHLRESHFLGTIVYVDGRKTANFREFIIIDGQQRLTSTMLLLKALSNKISDINTKDDIIKSYLINERVPDNLRIKLKPVKSDAEIYEKIINDEEIKDSKSNVVLNYKYFLNLIDQSALSPEEIYRGLQKLEIVYIQLNGEKENPQLIFESLNSTGLDLTQADLIRNYMLMGQSYENQEYLYKNYWLKIEKILPNALISDFIRDYLTLKTSAIPNKDKVYEEFKNYYERLKNYTSEELLKELYIYAEYYSWFRYCNSPNEIINDKLNQIAKLKSTVTYPFLLNIFESCYLNKKINEDELNKTLDILISYVFRRLICELPTNALNKVFCNLTKEIEKVNLGESVYDKVNIILLGKKGKAIFPDNNMLKEYIISKDFYNFKQCKYFLYHLEIENSKEIVEPDKLTIEHIMPQKLTAKWQVDLGKRYQEIYMKYINTIGNLTLSGYNSELSNKSFIEKKEILLKSNLTLNRQLNQYDQWNEKTIEDRAKKLYEIAMNIWKYPDEQYQVIIKSNNINNKREFEIMEDINVTGKEPFELTILGDRYNIESWREFFKTICLKMYEYDSEIFSALTKHKDFKGRTKRIITNDINSLRVPFKISEKIYIEQNLSANDALNYSKLVIEKFEGMENEVTYKIR